MYHVFGQSSKKISIRTWQGSAITLCKPFFLIALSSSKRLQSLKIKKLPSLPLLENPADPHARSLIHDHSDLHYHLSIVIAQSDSHEYRNTLLAAISCRVLVLVFKHTLTSHCKCLWGARIHSPWTHRFRNMFDIAASILLHWSSWQLIWTMLSY